MSPAEESIQESVDADLVTRAQDGDPLAFEEIFQRHKNQIYSLAYRMTGNAADAEDLCQDVFLTAFRKIGSFQGRSSFSTWLYRVAINRSKDFLRKKKRYAEVQTPDEQPSEAAIDEAADQVATVGKSSQPEAGAIASEAQRLVGDALDRLPKSLRLPLVLHELEGLQYQEVARLLHLPVGTVKSRIFRARLQLAEILEPHKEQWMK
jgi:RNA polymerase sigma-70 factor (ECF subfamily)